MNYQTTDHEQGVFPTLEWFEKIKAHVDFKDRSVADFGCAQGMMSILAKRNGAAKVVGVDNQGENINFARILAKDLDIDFIYGNIEDNRSDHYDIKILSMIIHWIGFMETLRQSRYTNKLIIIFREANEAYDHPDNGKWFPTLEQLDDTFRGFSRKHSEVLMEQDNHKKIVLAIYDRT